VSDSSGISFLGLLTIVFITLKLCNIIVWSWWLVLSPIWIPIALVLIVLVVFGILVCVTAIVDIIMK